MAKRTTIERVLRDDDATGATVRGWNIAIEGMRIIVRPDHGDFLFLNPSDADLLIEDLKEAQRMCLPTPRQGA